MTLFSSRKQFVSLIAWFALTFLFAGIGALASAQAATFYQSLLQPQWAPPAWLFGPVWTGLYCLMALSAWMVWREYGWRGLARSALILFVLQLVLNALWTWLFFVWHQGALAFAEIQLLLALIIGTIVAFWRLNKWAAVLLLPYMVWVCFASVLCHTIWQLNPAILG